MSMSIVEVHIWYDGDGKITAVGRPHPSSRQRVIPAPGRGREVISAQIAEEYITALHRTHLVDVREKRLAPIAR